MIHYSVQSRYQVYVKGYRFLSFARYMGKNIGKKYKQKLKPKTCWSC